MEKLKYRLYDIFNGLNQIAKKPYNCFLTPLKVDISKKIQCISSRSQRIFRHYPKEEIHAYYYLNGDNSQMRKKLLEECKDEQISELNEKAASNKEKFNEFLNGRPVEVAQQIAGKYDSYARYHDAKGILQVEIPQDKLSYNIDVYAGTYQIKREDELVEKGRFEDAEKEKIVNPEKKI